MEDIDYDIQILDSPHDMRDIIIEKNHISSNRARIWAGYCWNWLKDGVNNTDVHDICRVLGQREWDNSRCGFEYEANGCDVAIRKCPKCM